jgi:hypothetical protein
MWAILLVSAPFFRYLIGTVLIDTSGSLLAAGLLHASFNASGALPNPVRWVAIHPGHDRADARGRRPPLATTPLARGRLPT